MNTSLLNLILIISTLSLTACSGDSDSHRNPTSPIQGFFKGATSNGFLVSEIVLEDGSFWTLYGIQPADSFIVQGVSTGNLRTGTGLPAGLFNVSYTDFPVPGNVPIAGSGFGTYTPSSLTATLTENGATYSVDLTRLPPSIYTYNMPAVISSIAGTWSGDLLNGETSTINIVSDGTMTGTSSTGCTYTGTFTPRPSGVNIFDVTFHFGSAPCFIPNQTASGIALTSSDEGAAILFFAATTPASTAGTAFFAMR